jgi:hypothetical protein
VGSLPSYLTPPETAGSFYCSVMAGHSGPKDGVLSHAYVPAITSSSAQSPKDVDARHKAGHDGTAMRAQCFTSVRPRASGDPGLLDF